MSVAAYSYVMTVTCHIPSHIAQSILAHLADHADRFGRHAFPSVPTLAKDVRCSDRTVQRHLRWLEEHGFIRRSRNLSRVSRIPAHKRPIVYEISLDDHARSRFAAEYREHAGAGAGDTVDAGAVTATSSKPPCEPSPLSPEGDSSPKRVRPRTPSGTEAAAFLIAFADILRREGIAADRPRRSDRRAAVRLMAAHGAQPALDMAAWVASDGFWCGKMLNVRSLERRWEELRLARRHERAKRRTTPAPQGTATVIGADTAMKHPAVLVSSSTVARCPVYGYRTFPAAGADRTGEAQRHLDGIINVEECPLCAHDDRNRPLHGGSRGDRQPMPSGVTAPPMGRTRGRW